MGFKSLLNFNKILFKIYYSKSKRHLFGFADPFRIKLDSDMLTIEKIRYNSSYKKTNKLSK